jgi:L-threonylcarbamoyladenylate synthase
MADKTDNQPSHTVLLDGAIPDANQRAADCLNTGGVIVIPTDTVYGVASSVSDPAAVQRIFDVKRRPADRPLPVLLSSAAILDRFAGPVPDGIMRLLDRFWPGPLTVVVRCRVDLPPGVLAADGTVGFRVPDHPLALDVIAKAGGAVACTSANRSGDPPATSAQQVAAALGDDVDVILDGGESPGGVPSTVIAIENGELRVLREGALSERTLREVLAETAVTNDESANVANHD